MVYYAMTYEKAIKRRPDSAAKALGIEVDVLERKNVWHEVHEQDLSPEQVG
jgi:hypothetical protein